MSEETKNVEEVVEDINPIDGYLNNYKEQKLAEFCVQKDKIIKNYKNEYQKSLELLEEQKRKVKEYDKCFSSVNGLYDRIKDMPVDDYLNLYNMFVDDISKRNVCTSTITSSGVYTTTGRPW